MKIKKSFSSVVHDLNMHIQHHCELENVLTLLKSYDRDLGKLLKDCKTLGEVFNKISDIISFFDYDLIKLLGRKLGSVAIKKKLFKYKKRFQDFSKRRVCECPSGAFGKVKDSEMVYVIKTDKSLESLTVEELQKLEYNMNRILGDHHELLQFLNIKDGCVQLEFRTLKRTHSKLSHKDMKALRNLGVLSVHLGDMLVEDLVQDPMKGLDISIGECLSLRIL